MALAQRDTDMHDAAQRLWQLWQADTVPELDDFLHREGALTSIQLLAVLRVDQQERWLRGRPRPAEAYLESFPEVAAGRCALDLVYGEFLVREYLGQTPDLDEYAARFPPWADELRMQVELHRLMQSSAAGRGPRSRVAEDAPSVPGYDLLGRLGHGGMGVVHKARHLALNRLVALKALAIQGAEARRRFQAEYRAVARLHHPHIVTIFDVGEQDGRPYFTMELLEGGSLAERLRGAPQPPRDAAALVETLARAVDHAHQAGVVHRDLKPGNVLFDTSDPKITDFGLALELDAETLNTRPGDILGTPPYMAPEQVDARRGPVGPATDVYALGAILYEMLTGRPPFTAATALEVLELVRTADPVPPTRLQPRLPRDLETVCLKCLEKDPARRYPTAGALADDLRRFLDDVPIQARSTRWVGRVVKWVRRRPAAATLAAVTLLAALGFLVEGALFTLRLQEKTTYAQEQEQAAREALGREAEQGYLMRVALAQREVREGHATRAYELLRACPPEHRGWEWPYLNRLCLGGAAFHLFGHDREIRDLALSPDGRTLVTAGADATLRVWDAVTGRERHVLRGHTAPVRAVAFRGDEVVSAGEDGAARLWDVRAGRALGFLERSPGPLFAIAVSPDGQTLATGTREGWLSLRDAATGSERQGWQGHAKCVWKLAFSPDGSLLASGGHDNLARLWDARTGAPRGALTGHAREVMGLAFTPDGRQLATTGWDLTLRIWDVASGRERFNLRLPDSRGGRAVAFSPDGRRLAAGDGTGSVHFWEAATGRAQEPLHGHQMEVQGLAFTPDGQRVVTAGGNLAAVWDVRAGPGRLVLRHGRTVRALDFSPDGRRLATGDFGGRVTLWDAVTGHAVRTWSGHQGEIYSLAYSPRGDLFVTCAGPEVKVWEAATGREVHALTGHTRKVLGVAFAPDGTRLATGSSDGTVGIWDAATGRLLESVLHAAPVWEVAFSPDGTRMASGSHDGRVRLWECSGGRAILTGDEPFHHGHVPHVAFSADSQRLVSTGGFDLRVQVWDARTGEPLTALRGLNSPVWTVRFSPDGRRLLTCGEDGGVKLWDARTGQELLLLHPHRRQAWVARFSPDGRRIATGGPDCTVQVWDSGSAPLAVALTGQGHVTRGVACHPDGRRVAVATTLTELMVGFDQQQVPSQVGIWDIATGRELTRFPFPGRSPRVAFDPTGRLLTAVGDNGTTRTWDLATGEVVANPVTPSIPAPTRTPHPDGRHTLIGTGRWAWLVDEELSEEELARRQALARPDPVWHAAQAGEALRDENWPAARFHLRQSFSGWWKERPLPEAPHLPPLPR